MWNFYLNYTNELVYKTETESQKTDIENKLTITEGETEGGIKRSLGLRRTHPCVRSRQNNVRLCGAGSSTQTAAITYEEKGPRKSGAHLTIAQPLCRTARANMTL